jgi:hypothetical protein
MKPWAADVREGMNTLGLISGHAYSVLAVREVCRAHSKDTCRIRGYTSIRRTDADLK